MHKLGVVGVWGFCAALAAGCSSDDVDTSTGNWGDAGIDASYSDPGINTLEQEQVDPAAGGAAQTEFPASNPFVLVEHDPLSTFAADVDTASYDLYRSRGASGVRTDEVRLEEFVNYFHYDYEPPAADAEHPFAIHLSAAPNLVKRSTHLLRVGIQGVDDYAKPAANLVYLVDVSGSMASNLSTVKAALRATIELLEPTDRIAIVTYASNPGTVLASTPVSEKETILAAINALESGGATNGAGGITAAYAEAESAMIDGGINHVLLCTDGDFNVGISSDQALTDLIVEKRKSGVTLTALGFGSGGGSYNDSMMEAVSNAGNGIYSYIANADEAQRYVEERMLQSMIHIAKDMKLQVEFNPEHVYAYRLLGYENRAIADNDFRNDVIDAGEIGLGHRVTALYELVFQEQSMPPNLSAAAGTLDDGAAFTGLAEVATDDLVLVKVRYKQPGASETDAATEVAASLSPEAVHDGFETTASDFQFAAAVASYAEILKESPFSDEEALSAIHVVLKEQASVDTDRALLLELFETDNGL